MRSWLSSLFSLCLTKEGNVKRTKHNYWFINWHSLNLPLGYAIYLLLKLWLRWSKSIWTEIKRESRPTKLKWKLAVVLSTSADIVAIGGEGGECVYRWGLNEWSQWTGNRRERYQPIPATLTTLLAEVAVVSWAKCSSEIFLCTEYFVNECAIGGRSSS